MRTAYIDEAKATIFYSRALIEVNVCQEDDERLVSSSLARSIDLVAGGFSCRCRSVRGWPIRE